MESVDDARDALNTVVSTRLTPEQRESCVYEYRTQSVCVKGDKPLGGEGPWTAVKARSGKVVPKRWASPLLTAANDEYLLRTTNLPYIMGSRRWGTLRSLNDVYGVGTARPVARQSAARLRALRRSAMIYTASIGRVWRLRCISARHSRR